MAKRVVVVGGGVIGLCAAHALHNTGVEVTVVEAGATGQGASRVNAGWVCPSLSEPVPAPGLIASSLRGIRHPDSPLAIKPSLDLDLARWLIRFWRHCNDRDYHAGLAATGALNARTLELYDHLLADGVRMEHHEQGILFAYVSPRALESDLRAMEALRQFGIDVPTAVWGNELQALEPALSDAINGGFLYPMERHVRPDTMTSGLVDWLSARQVSIRIDSRVTGFDHVNGQVNAVKVGDERLPCDAVVIAAGVWSGRVARLLGVNLPLQGGKGYALDFSPAPISLNQPIYLHEARIAMTPLDGLVRLAGTMEFSGINDVIRPERVAAIARGAGRSLAGWRPDPANATIGSGLRPMTPDGLPCIGWLKGFRNAAVATGHAMHGLTLAPATAEAIATLVATGRAPEIIRPFDPCRFS